MTRKPDDWMPLHIGPYLADTTNLTRDQHGAYLLLLMAYWRRGGPLPADDGQLAAMAKASPAEWRKLKHVISPLFTEVDGKWVQKRADVELAKAKNLTAAKADAGRKGAASKWQDHGKGDDKRMAEPSTIQWQTDAPLPTPISEEEPPLRGGISASKKTRRQLPVGFPAFSDLEWAKEIWLQRGRADLVQAMPDEIEKFRDHHGGKLTTSADWPGSWRTWARNAMKFNNGAHSVRPRPSAHENFATGAILAAEDFAARHGDGD